MKKKHIDERIEKKRFLFFQVGLIIAITLVIIAFNIRGKATSNLPETEVLDTDTEWRPVVVVMEEERKDQEPEKEKPVSMEIFKIDPFNEKNHEKEIADKVVFDSSIVSLNIPDEIIPEDTTIHSMIDFLGGEGPSFPGGENAMMRWIMKNTDYPDLELKHNIGGRVTVTFIVEKNGSISNAKVVKGVSPGLDREAIKAVEKMPGWQPALQNGNPVRVRVVIPVLFKVVD